ncbi:unnamed protein product [Symbiodinium sp. KB8]|nr:unnamed protein product [Symbiodinium sp. KB8]
MWYRMSSESAKSEDMFSGVEVAARVVRDTGLHEVILDSGADCTVLPQGQFESVGADGGRKATLVDAQGNTIPQTSARQRVLFEVEGENAEMIQFTDYAVLANVKQPLFCFGKLLKNLWQPVKEDGAGYLRRDDSRFGVHWSKNSLATFMRISRVSGEAPTESGEEPPKAADDPSQHAGDLDPLRLRLVLSLSEHIDVLTKEVGWGLSAEGYPAHLGMNMRGTLDASDYFLPDDWPLRVTLLWRGGSNYEVFEDCEPWGPLIPGGPCRYVEFDMKERKVLTILVKEPIELESLGGVVEGELLPRVVPRRDPPEPAADEGYGVGPVSAGADVVGQSADVQMGGNPAAESQPADEGAQDGGALPLIGPAPVEVQGDEDEAVQVNGKVLAEDSSLRELRDACKFLSISKNGAKAVVWARLKKEIVTSKVKASVQASEEIQKQFEREPLAEALPSPPAPELVALHEISRMPRAPWCEACVATRSREDNYEDGGTTRRENPVISMDYMFTGTKDTGLATHLVCVDSQSKFVKVVALSGKGGSLLKYATKEVITMTQQLGYSQISLHFDTEPAMKQLAESIQTSRLKMGFGTSLEPVDHNRMPVILEAVAAPKENQDEAASDPPSSVAASGDAAGNPVPSGNAASSSAMSTSNSAMSDELIPDQVMRTFREEIEEDLPTGHEPEPEVYQEDDDLATFDDEGINWEIEEILDEAKRRAYEDGPPCLDAEKLALLDAEMDKVEEERLLSMGVLKELTDETKKAEMYKLSCKFVRDWRFRDEWKRRPTYIETSRGVCYELKYNLPDNINSFAGAPALFIEPKSIAVLTHVDDIETVCERKRAERLKFLKRKMHAVEGGIFIEQDKKHITKLIELTDASRSTGKHTPCPAHPHQCSEEVLLEGEQYNKYRTAIGILLYLGPDRPDILYAVKVLSSRTTTPRQHEWKLLCHPVRYLKEHDNQGLLFTSSWPGRTLEQRCLELEKEDEVRDVKSDNLFHGKHLLESVSDASWCSEPGRLSVSCSILYVNGNPFFMTSKRQKTVVLSSCEAELHGALLSLQEAFLIKKVLECLTCEECECVHRVDNSACRALLNREGLGGLKHVDLRYLWVQQKRKEGAFSVKAIGTKFCPADVGTQAHNATRLKLLSYMCGLSCAGLPVGREVFVAEWNLQATKKMAASASRVSLKQNLRQVLALSLLELGWSAQNNEYPEAMDYHINDFVFNVLFIIGILFVLVKINKLVSMLFGKNYKDKKITTASSTSLWSSSLNFGVVLIYFNLLGFAFGKNDLEKASASTSTSSWTSSTTSTWWHGEMIPFLVLFFIFVTLVSCLYASTSVATCDK